MAYQMLEHLRSRGLIHPNLHGGLKDLSPATAHIQIQEILMEAAANRSLSAVLMVDQSSAYDLLDHRILLLKMREYGLGDSFLIWMTSYLTGRTQCTKVQAKVSSAAEVEACGAPQGSILAGLLHLLSSNDCPAANGVGTSVLFVDDQNDVVVERDVAALEEKVQEQANSTCQWLRENRMIVAPSKTKLLLVSTREMAARRGLGPSG